MKLPRRRFLHLAAGAAVASLAVTTTEASGGKIRVGARRAMPCRADSLAGSNLEPRRARSARESKVSRVIVGCPSRP